MSFSNFWENENLDHLFGKGVYTPPTNIFVGLSTANPQDDGSGLAEPAAGYARVQTSPSDWTVAANGSLTNANTITFPTSTGSWGTINYVALFDAASGGNMLAWGALTTPKVVESGKTPKFNAGALTCTQD